MLDVDISLLIGGTLEHRHPPAPTPYGRSRAVIVERQFSPQEIATPAQAQHAVGEWVAPFLNEHTLNGIDHSGPNYFHPGLVDDAALETLESFLPLAPLHLLTNIDPIRIVCER